MVAQVLPNPKTLSPAIEIKKGSFPEMVLSPDSIQVLESRFTALKKAISLHKYNPALILDLTPNAGFVQGVGGAVHLPKGFLKAAYELIRERGGVCIADEVQTGFGRLGTHYWGFETEGVIPDIVTMAKGIGNGFPMAAVVTTPEIAKSFSQAVHFNTFGGNPIASAVGKAVLEAIDQDGTQENANVVGNYFLEKLLQVKSEFPDVVGDVRGRGLMIGVELVTDKESKTPLPAEKFVPIWEDIKDMGVLIGKGGLYGNVFRIKPPMCITKEDVDFGIEVMRTALTRYTLNE